mgnify:CR=1 FL=1
MNSTSEDGVVLESVVIDNWEDDKEGKATDLYIVNRALPNDDKTKVKVVKSYELIRDNFGYYKHFKIRKYRIRVVN